jgi:hypothetical protein
MQHDMGGTGLEPVTPSLSTWCSCSRRFAQVRSHSIVERKVTFDRTAQRTRTNAEPCHPCQPLTCAPSATCRRPVTRLPRAAAMRTSAAACGSSLTLSAIGGNSRLFPRRVCSLDRRLQDLVSRCPRKPSTISGRRSTRARSFTCKERIRQLQVRPCYRCSTGLAGTARGRRRRR